MPDLLTLQVAEAWLLALGLDGQPTEVIGYRSSIHMSYMEAREHTVQDLAVGAEVDGAVAGSDPYFLKLQFGAGEAVPQTYVERNTYLDAEVGRGS